MRQERGRLAARASQADRRRDTRQKILVGATVLAAVEHGGVPALASRAELERWLEPRLTRAYDRAAFGFETQDLCEVATSAGRFADAVAVSAGPVDGESRPSGALWRFFETALRAPMAGWR